MDLGVRLVRWRMMLPRVIRSKEKSVVVCVCMYVWVKSETMSIWKVGRYTH